MCAVFLFKALSAICICLSVIQFMYCSLFVQCYEHVLYSMFGDPKSHAHIHIQGVHVYLPLPMRLYNFGLIFTCSQSLSFMQLYTSKL